MSDVAALRAIWARHGFRRCWRGASAQMIRDAPAMGVYIVSYEALLDALYHIRAKRQGALGDVARQDAGAVLLAGAVAGMVKRGTLNY